MQIDKNNWQIQANEYNKKELEDYFNYFKKINKCVFLKVLVNSWYGFHFGGMLARPDKTPYLKCIDIYQFRKYILGKEPRKIIGYKAPFDMYDGEIKMGTLFELNFGLNIYSYYIPNVKIYSLPKEIVEKYFIPVYEEEEKVIELHGYRITFCSLAVGFWLTECFNLPLN